jgi:hypothetical protein
MQCYGELASSPISSPLPGQPKAQMFRTPEAAVYLYAVPGDGSASSPRALFPYARLALSARHHGAE